MGTNSASHSSALASALFSPVQQRVLGLLFGQPGRRFQSAELIRLVGSGTGAVHRQLGRLASSGWVSVAHVGNQKYYQANADCPAFGELQGLIAKTVGLVEPIRNALASLTDKIQAAFVFGSIAKGTDTADSDIDLFVISDHVGYPELYTVLQQAETVLARSVNPNVMTPHEWRTKRLEEGSFAARIVSQPHLFIIGSDDDIA